MDSHGLATTTRYISPRPLRYYAPIFLPGELTPPPSQPTSPRLSRLDGSRAASTSSRNSSRSSRTTHVADALNSAFSSDDTVPTFLPDRSVRAASLHSRSSSRSLPPGHAPNFRLSATPPSSGTSSLPDSIDPLAASSRRSTSIVSSSSSPPRGSISSTSSTASGTSLPSSLPRSGTPRSSADLARRAAVDPADAAYAPMAAGFARLSLQRAAAGAGGREARATSLPPNRIDARLLFDGAA